jgi:hypothetical protein
MAKQILDSQRSSLFDNDMIARGIRDGIEIEKGVVLNEDYLQKNFDNIGDMLSIFSAYPDIFLDFISPADSSFELFFY